MQKNWEAITFGSDSCRKNKIRPHSLDTAFESKILALLAQRRAIHGLAAKVTCEEVEQEVLCDGQKPQSEEGHSDAVVPSQPDGTKAVSQSSRTRERCRQAARRLGARDEIFITQDGKVVDPSFAKGVMQLKLPS